MIKKIVIFIFLTSTQLATAEVNSASIPAKIVKIERKTATVEVGQKRMQVARHQIPDDAKAGITTEVLFTKAQFNEILDIQYR